MSTTFASLLRQYRNERELTQEELAKAIKRKKMSISMFETEKNAPPTGALLESIISALSLSEKEAHLLRYYAAKERKQLPNGLEEYYFSTDAITLFLKTAKEVGLKEEGWVQLLELLKTEHLIDSENKEDKNAI